MLEYMTAAEERRMKAREGAAEHKKEAKNLFNETAKELEGIWKTEKTYILTESQLEQIKQEAKREGRAEAIEECARTIEISKTIYENHKTETIMATKDKCIAKIRNLKEKNNDD